MEKNGTSALHKPAEALLSVIIPVYNVAPYLDECLASVCGQTYRNMEIIVVDDGATEGSGQICDAWRERDSRIRVIHQKNAGVSAARNAGLDACTGQIISFVDADDWLDGQLYAKLVACLEENDADAAMCGFVDYAHRTPENKGLFPIPPCDYAPVVYHMMRRNGYFTSPWAKVFRRELVYRNGGPIRYDPALSFAEDEVWLLEVLREHSCTAFLPEPLYHYRDRKDSVGRIAALTEKQMNCLVAKNIALRLLPDDDAVRMLARGRFFNDCFVLKVKAYCCGDKKAMRTVTTAIAPLRRDWLRCGDFILMRKVKVLLIEMEMALRLPRGLVWWTNQRTH